MAMTELGSSSCAILCVCCLMLLSLPCGEISMLVNAHFIMTKEISTQTPVTWTTWCIAKPSAYTHALQRSLVDACCVVDCQMIRRGGHCFLPDTVAHHASFAINSYYLSKGANYWDCQFSNTSLIALTDPSNGNCHFVESQSKPPEGTVKREDTWCVAKPGTPENILKESMDYICQQLGNCSEIEEHGSCYLPNTTTSHASVAMNRYYKTIGHYNCNFNISVIVMTNPNYGECIYV